MRKRHTYLNGDAFYDKCGVQISSEVYAALKWDWNSRVSSYSLIDWKQVDADVQVSTTWIGIDLGNSGPDKPPLIFETMVIGGVHNGVTARYPTQSAAGRRARGGGGCITSRALASGSHASG